ncbi:branched-chain amino acid transport system II carrier protein [Candidimonas sp. SYP-B2681]|nr:branched-chain amino acid transport system II carrier protein [Candidimonas sp. SYP-B2681]
MSTLKIRDLIALGFMTFALFLGAGNIIFPPMVGQLSGNQLWYSALGFLLTGVGLPLLTVVALARVGGGMRALTAPIGKAAGILLGVLVYLTIGPLFATPRTAMVSFEVGFSPFIGAGGTARAIYTIVYFGTVMLLALFPGRLLDTIGKVITPVLIVALIVLGAAAIIVPAGVIGQPTGLYVDAPLSQGFIQGYHTMDALGAMVFGIVIINAIRSRGISDAHLVTRYAIVAGIVAAVGLALVYLALIFLGAGSGGLAPDAMTGAPILTAFVGHVFGPMGNVLLAVVITLACVTTAVGLVAACGDYFSTLLPMSYRSVVIVISLLSTVIAYQGLEQLIAVSIPVLSAIYPVAITLVALSLAFRLWCRPSRVFIPTLIVATLFGIMDGLTAAGFAYLVPQAVSDIPGTNLGLGWLMPVLLALAASAAYDRLSRR